MLVQPSKPVTGYRLQLFLPLSGSSRFQDTGTQAVLPVDGEDDTHSQFSSRLRSCPHCYEPQIQFVGNRGRSCSAQSKYSARGKGREFCGVNRLIAFEI
ncbi:uncharacterized protein BDW70DRAFT_126038 [Aspergillus foveolatus]|uniref:uncharacterized protein n=1 Tax=Aspergillus foveolatus TaxID=210207 RepID=UPI003CCDF91E